MKTLSIRVNEDFLNKRKCREEAGRILSEGLIEGMSELQLAQEIYFHALAFYFCKKTGRLPKYMEHADPIDLCDGGDTKARQAAFAASWLLPGRKLLNSGLVRRISKKRKDRKIKKSGTTEK